MVVADMEPRPSSGSADTTRDVSGEISMALETSGLAKRFTAGCRGVLGVVGGCGTETERDGVAGTGGSDTASAAEDGRPRRFFGGGVDGRGTASAGISASLGSFERVSAFLFRDVARMGGAAVVSVPALRASGTRLAELIRAERRSVAILLAWQVDSRGTRKRASKDRGEK